MRAVFLFGCFQMCAEKINGVKKTNSGPESCLNEQIHGRHFTISVCSTTAREANANWFDGWFLILRVAHSAKPHTHIY